MQITLIRQIYDENVYFDRAPLGLTVQPLGHPSTWVGGTCRTIFLWDGKFLKPAMRTHAYLLHMYS